MQKYESDKLRQYIERIENLMVEKVEVQENINDIFHQAKSDGFDPKIMKKVIKLKQMKTEDRETEDMLLCTYMQALGIGGNDIEEE